MSIRVLGLGNDLLADDRAGLLAAAAIGRRFGGRVETVCSSTSGFDLLDEVIGATRLLVIDTLATGAARPGTVFEVGAKDVPACRGGSPHYVGLFEAIDLGRALGLAVPSEVVILAVEPEDVLTVGGPMSDAVTLALDPLIERAAMILTGWIAAGRTTAAEGPPLCGHPDAAAGVEAQPVVPTHDPESPPAAARRVSCRPHGPDASIGACARHVQLH